MAAALGDSERGVELGGVEGGVDCCELGLGFGVSGARGRGSGEGGGGKGNGEEGREAGDGGDGSAGEGGPGADLTDVPPEVLAGWVADVDVELAHERRGWVWRGEEGLQRRGGLVSWWDWGEL